MSRQVVNTRFVLPPIDQRGNPPPLEKLPPVNDTPPELEIIVERPPDQFLRRPTPPGAPEGAASVVSAQDVLNVIRPLVGLTENPPGSNRTLIGQWYGFDGVPWCAETVSYGLYNAGFNDGAGHITLVEPTTDRGWAYVPFLEKAFRDAGKFDSNPRVGDAVIFDWNGDGLGDHTGLVESINDDGTLNTLEGNVDSQLKRERRGLRPVRGFCHPPYSGDSGSQPPDHPRWPGRLITLSTPHMTGNDIRQWQQQMAHRGWGLGVDGDYGPRSHDVCVQFQTEKGLNPDGVVGPMTWDAAWTTPVTP